MFSIRKNLSSSKKRQIAQMFNFKCQNKPGQSYFLLNDKAKQIIQFNDYYSSLYKNNNGNFTKKNTYQIDNYFNVRFGGSDNHCNLYPLCEICHKVKTERGDLLHRLIPKYFFCNKPCWNMCNEKFCCKSNLH